MSCRQGQWLFKISLLSERKAHCCLSCRYHYVLFPFLLAAPDGCFAELKGYTLLRPNGWLGLSSTYSPSLAPSYYFIKRPFQFEFNKPSPCKPRTSSQHCNPRCFIAQAPLLSGWKARSHLLAQPPLPSAWTPEPQVADASCSLRPGR